MHHFNRAAVLCLLALLPGCAGIVAGLTAPKYYPIEEGATVPAGQVLVIGRVELDPPVEPGRLEFADVWDMKGRVTLAMTHDLTLAVDPEALVPIVIEEGLFAENGPTSFVPMPPGTRYVRMGELITLTYCSVMAVGPTGGCRALHQESVRFIDDIRITVPADARAVYIGTIVVEHDGETGTRTYIRDEFRTALRELDAMNIDGIDSRHVTKALAEIVTDQVVAR